MKKIILLSAFALSVGSAFAQVNGNINGSSIVVLNSKGELVFDNTSAAGIPMKIKSFSIDYTSNKISLSVSPAPGQNTISKDDMKLIQNAKGTKATIKNVIAIDKNGAEVSLPNASFTIE